MPSRFPSAMPEQDHIIALYDAQALSLTEMGGALASLFASRGARSEHLAAIDRHTAEARAIARELLLEAPQAFAAARDQSAVTDLFVALGDMIGEVEQTATTIQHHDSTAFDRSLLDLSHVVVDAIDTAGTTMPLLRSPNRYRARLLGLASTLVELGDRADGLCSSRQRALPEASPDSTDVTLYAHLKCLADRLRAVADKIARVGG